PCNQIRRSPRWRVPTDMPASTRQEARLQAEGNQSHAADTHGPCPRRRTPAASLEAAVMGFTRCCALLSVLSFALMMLAEPALAQRVCKPAPQANCQRATLAGINLKNANLTGINLLGADLTKADLSGANLAGAEMSGANLAGANLYGTSLTRANLP